MAIHKRGSGTVYNRGNVWWVQYYINGVPVLESSGQYDKTAAENFLKQRQGDVAAGRIVGPSKATIADLCDLVVQDYQIRRLRDLAGVQWRLNAHVLPHVGSLSVARFGSAQVKRYIEHPAL